MTKFKFIEYEVKFTGLTARALGELLHAANQVEPRLAPPEITIIRETVGQVFMIEQTFRIDGDRMTEKGFREELLKLAETRIQASTTIPLEPKPEAPTEDDLRQLRRIAEKDGRHTVMSVDVDRWVSNGWLTVDGASWNLTEEGQRIVGEKPAE